MDQESYELLDSQFRVLIGQPLSDMFRYAGLQRFDFGEQRPSVNSKGLPNTISDWGLVVGCNWQIDGPDGFRLQQADYRSGPGPEGPNIHEFFEMLEKDPPKLLSYELDALGTLTMVLERGYQLRVEACSSSGWEQWRLVPQRTEAHIHLIYRDGRVMWDE